MTNPVLYRRRIIPDECIQLKDDVILECNEDRIVTSWNAIRPKKDLHHGYSCYFLKEGFKVSKFYYEDGRLLYWYCDIVEYQWNKDKTALTSIDLLADVIVYPDGRTKVMDLDELADACERGIISSEQLQKCLRQLDKFLSYIYENKFELLQNVLEAREL